MERHYHVLLWRRGGFFYATRDDEPGPARFGTQQAAHKWAARRRPDPRDRRVEVCDECRQPDEADRERERASRRRRRAIERGTASRLGATVGQLRDAKRAATADVDRVAG
ncbi:MAG: hypothetical protein F4Y57_08990 [Acidobacteria bacterium]|nr:hypothetical protein [Acidobacteriota bacterium]